MKIQTWTLAGLTLAGLLAACGPATNEERGGVQIAVTARGAAARTAGQTYLVTASVSGPATGTLTLAAGATSADPWTGSLINLPVGVYVVTAEATESPSGKVFRATGACPVSRNVVSLCSLALQQLGGTTTFEDVAPLIGGLSVSDGAPHYGEPLEVAMTASFVGASAQYSIASFCAGVAEPAGAVAYLPAVEQHPALAGWDHTFTWSALLSSTCRGPAETVVFNVTDAKALSSTVSLTFGWNAQGLAIVAQINHWPDLGQFVTTDTQIPAGGSFSVLGVGASDADDDPLTYAWTSACGGSFDDAAFEKTTFTAPAAFAGPCKLSLAVADGKGGSNRGYVTIQIGEPAAVVHSTTVVRAAGVEVVSVPGDAPPGLGGSLGKVTLPVCANPDNCKGEYYFTPADLFGHPVTLGQVKSLAFWTKKAATQPDDWFLNVYTVPYAAGTVGPHGSWYGARVNSVPALAENQTANAGQWINWTSEPGSDWLRFSETTGNNFAPATLHLPALVASSSFAGVPFAGQPVLYFSVQTASNTETTFAGQLDGFFITLTDGSTALVDFE